jgi:hypothetical protein
VDSNPDPHAAGPSGYVVGLAGFHVFETVDLLG